ncbi:ubiquitin carboxyl-terminal hydrolase 2 [Magnaporthiopsis poae ATCC 64411]|uniref:Ubiquitin carboxyl-terminal hydrolase 2 n=1 Tax=Magnaporthiopsis poae (strain ATCC 64411 / 73-15) TaxID=644358 RepID=A0A0C4DZS4_MAGP6|nr:ubiquitin carboxyl-terminal hydrolase 2 [Magnaporthiopsis poae ATCC 64411]
MASAAVPTNGKVLLHFDDVVNPTPKISSASSIEAVITEGEQCLRNADAFRNFGRRPDFALREYVAATIIAIDLVPKNKDFPKLSDRKSLAARHTELMKKIQSLHPAFEKIKEEIKRDNQRTGVQPLHGRQSPVVSPHAGRPSVQFPNGSRTAQADGYTNGGAHSPRLSQDSVDSSVGVPNRRPGAASTVGASKAPDLLAERFAKLRGQKSPVDTQGPLFMNGTDAHPAPEKPRSTPAERAGISLASPLPDLPKMPAAIYSPARGTVSHESANLPSSNARGMFSRTGSSTPLSASQTRSPQLKDEYFAPIQSTGPPAAPVRPKVVIPDGDTVTPEDLLNYMKASSSGFRTLIIDIRSREDFDDGHIMSQCTICIEPEILQRENISAEEVADSMILAPQAEQQLFRRRGECDLIVFYDEDSEEINWRGVTATERALLGLYNALKHFDYDSEATKPAKLLKGGIDAWAGLMGRGALRTSSTATNGIAPGPKKSPAPLLSPASKRQPPRPIQDAVEAQRWEETLSNVENNLVRTQEDFLRRYPSVGHIKESMTSPAAKPEPRYPASAEIYSSLPSPPTRPAPAVPRQSYSGLRETGQEEHYSPTTVATKTKERKDRPRPVGLSNPGVWCYGNASIQALFHSYGFAADLMGSEWQSNWVVPKRKDENLNNPQLLTKIIANLFHWMSDGKFESMQCKTLMDYCCYVDSKQKNFFGKAKGVANALGSRSKQQDAEEFVIFVMENIHDETNRLRDVTVDMSKVTCQGDRYEHALAYWKGYRSANDSIIDKYWRGLTQNVLQCKNCGNTTYNHEPWDKIRVTVPPGKKTLGLMDLLHTSYPYKEIREDYRCEKCKLLNTTTSTIRLARMPELLCISLGRFNPIAEGHVTKVNSKVTYPIEDLDLTPIADPTPPERGQGHEWEGSFKYYCYAAIIHGGDLQSGHYTAFVRDRGSEAGDCSWYYCNDTSVTPRTIDSDAAAEAAGMYSKDSTTSAYILFYRRRPVGMR